jgi:hypothetical protein
MKAQTKNALAYLALFFGVAYAGGKALGKDHDRLERQRRNMGLPPRPYRWKVEEGLANEELARALANETEGAAHVIVKRPKKGD